MINRILPKNILGKAFLLLFAVYSMVKGFDGGDDFDVYLFASKQLLNGLDIYSDNPYNFYLYSPLFACLLTPISILDFELARFIWAILNVVLAYRLWCIASQIIRQSLDFDSRLHVIWSTLVVIISFGFLNYNIVSGQITEVSGLIGSYFIWRNRRIEEPRNRNTIPKRV